MADTNDPNNPNNAALMDARRRVGAGGQLLDSIVQGSNCKASCREETRGQALTR